MIHTQSEKSMFNISFTSNAICPEKVYHEFISRHKTANQVTLFRGNKEII